MGELPVFAHEHCAILALNNIGVQLLEQGLCEHAKVVFQDAIAVVNTLLKYLETPEISHPVFAIDGKVKRAHHWSCQLPPHCHKPTRLQFVTVSHSLCGTFTINSPDKLPIDHVVSMGTAFPIRMDVDGPAEDYLDESNLEFESAIILHNMGVSYLSLGLESQSVEDKDRLGFHAANSFLLAQSVLQDLTASSRTDKSRLGLEVLDRSLHTEFVVLHSLVPLMNEFATGPRSEFFRQRQLWVVQMSRELHSKLRPLFSMNSESAAAA